MARKHSDTAVLAAPPQQTNEEADKRAGALADAMMDAAANGQDVTRAQSGVIPMTPEQVVGMGSAVQAKRERKARDPHAIRPMYLLVAVHRDTDLMRIVGTAPTIGQARKQLPNCAYAIRDSETGPCIARAKLVS